MSSNAKVTKQERDWQAESDLNTLTRAHEIRQDKGRHARAKAHGRKQLAAMQAACR